MLQKNPIQILLCCTIWKKLRLKTLIYLSIFNMKLKSNSKEQGFWWTFHQTMSRFLEKFDLKVQIKIKKNSLDPWLSMLTDCYLDMERNGHPARPCTDWSQFSVLFCGPQIGNGNQEKWREINEKCVSKKREKLGSSCSYIGSMGYWI